jgi:hypothetical protein
MPLGCRLTSADFLKRISRNLVANAVAVVRLIAKPRQLFERRSEFVALLQKLLHHSLVVVAQLFKLVALRNNCDNLAAVPLLNLGANALVC